MRYILLFIGFFFLQLTQAQQGIRINEVCNKNINIILDEDGDYEGWMEIYNADTMAINLKDYYLSDDKLEARKWSFPEIFIESDEYLLVFASGKDRKELIHHWETPLNGDSLWKYKNTTEQTYEEYILWTENDFDDSDWESDYGAFGIGYDSIATQTIDTTIYLRQEFFLIDTSKVLMTLLHAFYDDGFVAYLNGFEILRMNMLDNGVKPELGVPAYPTHTSDIDHGELPNQFVIPPKIWKNILKNGRNVLAIQTHKTYNETILIKPWLSLAMSDSILQTDSVVPWLPLSELPIHTNFKVNKDGESVYLNDEYGLRLQKLEVPYLPSNSSYGFLENQDSLVYFTSPSPFLMNSGPAFSGVISDSVLPLSPSGFYQDSIWVTLMPFDSIYKVFYSLDGSPPSLNSYSYDSAFYLDSTAVLRVRYFNDSLMPGPMTNLSYFINDSSSIDVYSIISDPYNLWDEEYGIYVFGEQYYPVKPYFGANFWQDWERPVHIQYFNEEKEMDWQQDAGIKIHGNYTRMLPQKSLGLYAKSKYGISRFNHSIPNKEHITDPKRFLLRNAGNDYDFAHFRDLLVQQRMMNTHNDIQAGKPVLAFINGDYWGLYHIREKIDRYYLENNHGVNSDEVNLLEQNGLIISGDRTGFESLVTYIENNDLSQEAHYEYISDEIDIDNWIDNLISNLYHFNTDWPHHNTKFWNAPNKKWRQILVDQDMTTAIWSLNKAYKNPLPRIHADSFSYLAIFYQELIKNENFKRDYSNRFADLMNTIFLEEEYLILLDSIMAVMAPEMHRHGEKWNHNTENWLNGYYTNNIREFIEDRSPYMRQFLREEYSLGQNDTITLAVNPVGKGKIKLNSLIIEENNWSGLYFDSIPIRLEAIPNPGFEFVAWESPSSPQLADSSRIIENWYLRSNDTISALFYSETGQEDTLRIAFTEINYRSFKNADAGDWIEIYNLESDTLDLSSWTLRAYQPFKKWVLPEGSKIAPSSYLVLVSDTTKFKYWHPNVDSIIGPFDFGLNSESEELSLWDHLDRMVSHMSFSGQAPWPINDGSSKTIELLLPNEDYHQAENWSLGCPGGSPGTAPKDCEEQHSLLFTEINYKSADLYNSGDWVEIINTGNETIDLSKWLFKDSNTDDAFSIPTNTLLQAQQRLVLVKDTLLYKQFHEKEESVIGPFDFGLSSAGENISMSNPFDQSILSLTYETSEPWPENSSGSGFTIELMDTTLNMHDGESWESNCFLGTPLQAPEWCIQANSILISEIKYQSLPDEESGDWIELYNSNDREVNLLDWMLIHSNDTLFIDTNYYLAPHSYIVIASDTAQFYSVYDTNLQVLSFKEFDLNKEEDAIFILNPYKHPGNMLSYHYLLNWPVFQIDTNNRTLELIDYSNTLIPDNWRAGCEDGTPNLDHGYCDTEGLNSLTTEAYPLFIHPNPSAHQVNIELELFDQDLISVQLHDLKGNLVLRKEAQKYFIGKHTINLNLQGLASGVYLLELQGKNGSSHQKLIKLEE